MNSVSMGGSSAYGRSVSRNAVSLSHSQSMRFGGAETDTAKKGLLASLELSKGIYGGITGVLLEPFFQPLKANAKKLFWDAEENTVGPLSRQIKKGVNKVRGLFNKAEETEAEKLGKEAKKLGKGAVVTA